MAIRDKIVPKRVCGNRIPLGVIAAAAAMILVFAAFVTGVSAVSSASVGRPEKDVPKFDANPPVQKVPPLGKGVLLVADRGLPDPNFAESVVLLADYGSHGAMGFIINRPTEITLTEAFSEIPGIDKRKDRLYAGGPVGIGKARYIARFDVPPKGAHFIFEDVYLCPGVETLERLIADSAPPNRFRVFAGYAGWAPGQLEHELSRKDWIVVNSNAETVFRDDPENIWKELIERSSGRWVRLISTK